MDGMDRKIEKKRFGKKQIWLSVGILLVLLIFVQMVFGDKSARLNVDLNKITIGEITSGKYQDYISVNGTVEPIQTIYLDAVEL
jgi:HlyD family secretion protein